MKPIHVNLDVIFSLFTVLMVAIFLTCIFHRIQKKSEKEIFVNVLFSPGGPIQKEVNPALVIPMFDRLVCCLPAKWLKKCWCGIPHDRVQLDDAGILISPPLKTSVGTHIFHMLYPICQLWWLKSLALRIVDHIRLVTCILYWTGLLQLMPPSPPFCTEVLFLNVRHLSEFFQTWLKWWKPFIYTRHYNAKTLFVFHSTMKIRSMLTEVIFSDVI